MFLSINSRCFILFELIPQVMSFHYDFQICCFFVQPSYIDFLIFSLRITYLYFCFDMINITQNFGLNFVIFHLFCFLLSEDEFLEFIRYFKHSIFTFNLLSTSFLFTIFSKILAGLKKSFPKLP